MPRILLTGILLFASARAAAECGCLWQGSFTEVAGNTDLVAVGEVVRVRGNSVDVRIEHSYRGEAWINPIRVWMQARDYCRPEAARFPVGSRWVMALDQITDVPPDGFNPSTPNISFGREGDYALSSCGGYFLAAEGDGVIGNLVPGMPRWEYTPEMTPVLLELVAGFLDGSVTGAALKAASEEDPAARELMLDTRSFLRGQDAFLDDKDND